MLRYCFVFLAFSFSFQCCSTSPNGQEPEEHYSNVQKLTVDSFPLPTEKYSPEEIDSILVVVDLPLDSMGNYQEKDWRMMNHPRYLTGRFKAEEFADMVVVPSSYTDGDGTYYMHRVALDSFKVMHAAAQEDGVNLVIVSAFRNFSRQKAIWEAKWNGQRLIEGNKNAETEYPDPATRALAILRYSSMPSTSRHHWGTDIDLNRLNNAYFSSGEGLEVYNWLLENAHQYKFCQPYTEKGDQRPTGYEEEKWHWSFLPIAQPLTEYAREYLDPAMIKGFKGAEVADSIGVIENYVLGINNACLPK